MEVVILPNNSKGQSSLHGFFAKNSYSVSRSVATGASSAKAMPGSTASTCLTSARPESLVGRASNTAHNSVISRAGSSTKSSTQSSNGSKTFEGIIPSSCNFGNSLLLIKRYDKKNSCRVYEMNEFYNTGTYNLYEKNVQR